MHEFCDNCNRSLRDDETRARGDLNFAQMHLIIAHAVRGRCAQRCACYGRWMLTTCAGRSMRGTPTCTRTAALVAGEATGANALQAFANRAHATSRTRAIIAVFMFLPPVYTARLAAESGLRLVCACTTTRGIDASVARQTPFAPKNGIRQRNDLAAGPRERRSAPKSTDKSTTATKRARAFTREVSTSKRLTP